MTSSPRISILIPSYNARTWIEETIESALRQSVSPHEIFVQDGGSTDGTVELLRGYPELRYASEPDRGQSDALNRALSRTTGDIIGWLNADDVYAPGALMRVEEAFRTQTSVDVVYGDFALIDQRGQRIRWYYVSEWDWRRFISHGCYIFSGATFFRRSVFDRFGMFDESLHYCMDLEFLLRLGSDVETFHIPEVLGSLRIHDLSKSGSVAYRFVSEAHRVRWRYSAASPALRGAAVISDVRQLAYLASRRFWLSRIWRSARSEKRL